MCTAVYRTYMRECVCARMCVYVMGKMVATGDDVRSDRRFQITQSCARRCCASIHIYAVYMYVFMCVTNCCDPLSPALPHHCRWRTRHRRPRRRRRRRDVSFRFRFNGVRPQKFHAERRRAVSVRAHQARYCTAKLYTICAIVCKHVCVSWKITHIHTHM